jgi:hypothetical protein
MLLLVLPLFSRNPMIMRTVVATSRRRIRRTVVATCRLLGLLLDHRHSR